MQMHFFLHIQEPMVFCIFCIFLHFFAYPGANGFLHILHFFAFFFQSAVTHSRLNFSRVLCGPRFGS